MRKLIITAFMLTLIMLASCGQKADNTANSNLMNGFIYTSLDDAKLAAATGGKQMVLDFYFET